MWAQPGEQRQFLTAHQHVHRVDLNEAHVVEHASEMTAIDPTGGARRAEPLRAEREAPGFVERQALGAHQ
jgi:hypothetical protein